MINIMNDKLKMIINIVGFYIGWWGCILGSSDGLPYIGPLLMLLFIIVHVAFFVKDYKELQFIILIGIIGTIVDSGLVLSEYFVYAGAYSDDLAIAPLWITAMWAGFAAPFSINVGILAITYQSPINRFKSTKSTVFRSPNSFSPIFSSQLKQIKKDKKEINICLLKMLFT